MLFSSTYGRSATCAKITVEVKGEKVTINLAG